MSHTGLGRGLAKPGAIFGVKNPRYKSVWDDNPEGSVRALGAAAVDSGATAEAARNRSVLEKLRLQAQLTRMVKENGMRMARARSLEAAMASVHLELKDLPDLIVTLLNAPFSTVEQINHKAELYSEVLLILCNAQKNLAPGSKYELSPSVGRPFLSSDSSLDEALEMAPGEDALIKAGMEQDEVVSFDSLSPESTHRLLKVMERSGEIMGHVESLQSEVNSVCHNLAVTRALLERLLTLVRLPSSRQRLEEMGTLRAAIFSTLSGAQSGLARYGDGLDDGDSLPCASSEDWSVSSTCSSVRSTAVWSGRAVSAASTSVANRPSADSSSDGVVPSLG